MKKHIIKTSEPWIPDGYTLESNTDLGTLDLSKIKLGSFQLEKQKTGYIGGENLLKEIKQPLNSSVFKYLLDHQELIPKEWEKYWSVSFFGTVLRDSSGNRCVLYLYRYEGKWRWHVSWLGYGWGAGNLSAVLASSELSSTHSELSEPLSLDLEKRLKNVEQFMKDNFKGFTI